MLKAEAWPISCGAPNWQADAIGFRADAASRYTPSMQRINLDRIYRLAVRSLPKSIDGQPPLPVPQDCPYTLDELLAV